MRRIVLVSIVVLLAPLAMAQQAAEQPAETISHGDFAVLVMKTMTGAPQLELEPAEALAELKQLELVPADWAADAPLTHGELAALALRMGATYTPAEPEAPVSRAFAEAFLRRHSAQLEGYSAQRQGHGYSTSHVLDQGVDRGVVSPSAFP